MKRFVFRIKVDGEQVGDSGIIAIDQSVLDYGLSEEFRKDFHTFSDEAEVAAHIARCMILFGDRPSEIEGFIMDDSLATIIEYPHGYDDFEFVAEEE